MTEDHDFAGFDLNLLRVLDVLIRTRGVTRAAAELGLTQSGVSRSLKRLRDQLGDPLLVRDGRHMVPTAVALELAVPVARLLADARLLLVSGRSFDPAVARWTVRVASAGYGELVLLPGLLDRVVRRAPGVDVHMVGPGDGDALVEGRVDFAVALPGSLDAPDLVQTALFSDTLCCVVRRGHPAAVELTLDRYLDLDHVLIAPGGRAGGIVDVVLARQGLRRRVRAQVSGFTAPMPLITASDSVVTMPRRVAESMCDRWNLQILPPPMELPGFSVSLFWSAHRRTEPAHRWFRGVVAETASDIKNGSRSGSTPPRA